MTDACGCRSIRTATRRGLRRQFGWDPPPDGQLPADRLKFFPSSSSHKTRTFVEQQRGQNIACVYLLESDNGQSRQNPEKIGLSAWRTGSFFSHHGRGIAIQDFLKFSDILPQGTHPQVSRKYKIITSKNTIRRKRKHREYNSRNQNRDLFFFSTL